MNNIEEYKISLTQEQSVELFKNTLNKFEIRGEGLCLLKIAIKNVLSEREADKKRIKELEEENRIFKDSNVLVNRYFKLKDNSIPVQKVKDKKEELKKEYEIALEENSTKAFILKCKISAFEELLEEK